MDQKRQRLYEGMYILSATLSDDARKKALDRVTDVIVQFGGEIKKIFDQGRRKLAYEIDKKREGHYYLIYFASPTSAIRELWREYHLNEDLIRFVTLQAEEVPEKIEFKVLQQEQ